jgi:hypothetical protein
MLDMGFGPDIEKIAAHPTMPPKVSLVWYLLNK